MNKRDFVFKRYGDAFAVIFLISILMHISVLEVFSQKMPSSKNFEPHGHVFFLLLVFVVSICQAGALWIPKIVINKNALHVVGPGRVFFILLIGTLFFVGFSFFLGVAMLVFNVKEYLIEILFPYFVFLLFIRWGVFRKKKEFFFHNIQSIKIEYERSIGVIVRINDYMVECGRGFQVNKFMNVCKQNDIPIVEQEV